MNKNNNYDNISLYNVATLFREYYYQYELISYKANEELESMYGESIGISDYDYRNNTLIVIDMNSLGTVMGDCVEFYLNDKNELKNKPSINGTFLSFIYNNLQDFIKNVIKEYLNIKDFANYEYKEDLKKIKLIINAKGIFLKNSKFEIDYNYFYDKYIVYDNLGKEVKIDNNKIDKLLKNIYLRIDKLPEFMQEELYEIRKNEIDKGMVRKRIFFKEFFEEE